MAKDYYNLLGVDKDASPEGIKKAFRDLAHKHHPDKGGDAAKFKEINEAYQALSNPEKRKQYDQFGTTFSAWGGSASGGDQAGGGGFGGFEGFGQGGVNPGSWSGAGFDMGDLSEMFGDILGMGGRRSNVKSQKRGQDIEMNVRLSFSEAAFGLEKEFELYKTVACDDCAGKGYPLGSKMISCKTCGGQGRIRQIQRTILGSFETVAVCGDCEGSGLVPEKKCGKCAGTGAAKALKKLTVKIPAGIADGETVRVTGGGEAGYRGGTAGDLYLHVQVARDSRYTRKNFDVYSEISITFSEAALGAVKTVDTLDGPVDLKIPAGIQTGEEIRLKGRGIIKLGTANRGDQYVRIIVNTPKNPSRKAKELLQQLKEEGF